MKSREERVISGELKPSLASAEKGKQSYSPFDEEEEVEVLVDKGNTDLMYPFLMNMFSYIH